MIKKLHVKVAIGDFKSVDEVVRFYKLPNQKTKTSKDKVNSFSKSVCQCQNFK